jgi:GT2 family glycosyltransferase
MAEPKISILIPNYNGAALLEENIPYALAAARNSGASWELLVADDASTDQSCAFLKEHFPDVKLILGEKNLGFAGNCNRGAACCRGSWILLLNSDVKLHPDYLKILLPFTEDSSVFGVSGSILPDGPGPIMDAGKYPAWGGLMLNTTLNFYPKEASGTSFPSLFLSGAAAFLNAEKFRQLGGFQELFNPYYFEDAEISIHAWRRGWSSVFVPQAKCFHRISSTIASTAKQETIRMVARRNKLLLHEIHLDGYRRLLWKISLGFYRMLALLKPSSAQAKAFLEYKRRCSDASLIRKKTEAFPGTRPLSEVVWEIQESLKGRIERFF